MSYTKFREGYLPEDTWGVSKVDDADDIMYLFGVLNQESHPPSRRRPLYDIGTDYDSRELDAISDMWKGFSDFKGTYGFRAQNGLLAWAGLGSTSTVDDSPSVGYYTHTITPAMTLPSYTLQYERTGTGTAWATQYVGCKADSITLYWDAQEIPYLFYRVDWFAKESERMAFTLNNSPELPPTANKNSFKQLQRTYDSVNLPGLRRVEIIIENGLFSEFAHTWSDLDEYVGGIESIIESPEVKYTVNLTYNPDTIEYKFWDEYAADDNDSTAIFKFIRDATYDYLKVTCLGCQVIDNPIAIPDPKTRSILDVVTFHPAKMSIEVVDQIAGGYYT